MRRKLIAGNWKLHKTVPESVELAGELRRLLGQVRDCDIAICPTYPALYPVAQKLTDANVGVGAQNVYWETKGAFTGEVSAPMLRSAGCKYVIIAHSERRQLFGETDATAHKRLVAALEGGLVPIFCIGETLAEREAGRTEDVVVSQLEGGLAALEPDQLRALVIAYEPVWAIGTGKVATPAQAQEVHNLIRERLRAREVRLSDETRVLYGGSVKPDNAAELMGQADIDGALVGGASLEAASFVGIVKAR